VSNFTPAERVEVDRQYRILAKALHELEPVHADKLRHALGAAEASSTDPTLARVFVANEILRGVAWQGRAPLTVRDYAMSAELSRALSEAEKLGRAIGDFARPARRGIMALFTPRKKSFSQHGKEALMRCRAIGAAHEARQSGRRAGKSVRPV
jgi:hypothetical protein